MLGKKTIEIGLWNERHVETNEICANFGIIWWPVRNKKGFWHRTSQGLLLSQSNQKRKIFCTNSFCARKAIILCNYWMHKARKMRVVYAAWWDCMCVYPLNLHHFVGQTIEDKTKLEVRTLKKKKQTEAGKTKAAYLICSNVIQCKGKIGKD